MQADWVSTQRPWLLFLFLDSQKTPFSLASLWTRSWGRGSLNPWPLQGPWDPVPTAVCPLYPVLLLLGTDPEETILHAFKVFDTEGKGFVKADL